MAAGEATVDVVVVVAAVGTALVEASKGAAVVAAAGGEVVAPGAVVVVAAGRVLVTQETAKREAAVKAAVEVDRVDAVKEEAAEMDQEVREAKRVSVRAAMTGMARWAGDWELAAQEARGAKAVAAPTAAAARAVAATAEASQEEVAQVVASEGAWRVAEGRAAAE